MLFAFGEYEGSYYIANGRRSCWKSLPNSLSTILDDDYPLGAISLGEGGAWFYKKAPRANMNGVYCLSSATAINYPQVSKIYDSGEAINWVAFGPDGDYVVDTYNKLYSNCDLTRQYRSGNQVPLRSASFGYDGAWVVVEDDGEIRSRGLSAEIKAALAKKPVKFAQLSANSSTSYYIEYIDGDTVWCLPPKWHRDVQSVEKMTTRLDNSNFAVQGPKTVSQRIIFAFGHAADTYCISNGGNAAWRGINGNVVTEHLKRPGVMQAFSLGERGSCFWKQDGLTWLSTATQVTYPEVWTIWKSDETINWVAFGPQGYYIVDTNRSLYASRSNHILRNYPNDKLVPLRCASFGFGGAWVVVEDDGIVRSHGLSSQVLEKISAGNIRNIQLSMTYENDCYVEYMDGTTDWTIPKDWHATVSDVEGNVPKPHKTLNSSFTGPQRLQHVSKSDTEYNSIWFQFSTSWRHTERALPKIRYIYRITPASSSLEGKYQAYLKRVGNEQKMWHGTSRQCKLGDDGRDLYLCSDETCSLCQIIRTGYQKKYALQSGMCGTGIYSSTTSSKAALFSKNMQASEYNAIMLNNVAVGRMFYTNKAENGRTAPPYGYDSVCVLPGFALKHDETCVYDDDAIRPAYLILYDAES